MLKPEALGQLKLSSFEARLPRENLAPNDAIPAIVHDGHGGLKLADVKWGDPGAPYSTYNARDDRLDEGSTWKKMVGRADGHAVIVVSHAFEPFTKDTLAVMGEAEATAGIGAAAVQEAKGGETVWHGLVRQDGGAILIPALLGERGGQAWATMVTTTGGPVFSRLHRPKSNPTDAREIVSLRDAGEVQAWMHPEDHPDFRQLLRPSTPEHMRSYRCPPGCMKKAADVVAKFQEYVAPAVRPAPQRTLF